MHCNVSIQTRKHKDIKVTKSSPIHEFWTLNILLHINLEPKGINRFSFFSGSKTDFLWSGTWMVDQPAG